MLYWWTSHYVQSTSGASRHSFPEVVQVNCRPSTWHRLELEWHEILHQWNVRMNIFLDRAKFKTWSHICCLSYWRLAQHIASLPQERWIRRNLRWCPVGRHRTGRPHFHWESKLESYCRYKGLGRWIEAAMNRDVWDQHCKSFIEFCCT